MNPGNSRARATLRNVLRGERNHRFALGGGLNLSSFSPDTERPNFLCIMGRKKFREEKNIGKKLWPGRKSTAHSCSIRGSTVRTIHARVIRNDAVVGRGPNVVSS